MTDTTEQIRSDAAPAKHATGRTVSDWVLFLVLSTLWALAYSFTRIAVDKGNPEAGLPVAWVLPGRLMLGAIIMWGVMLATGGRLPPLTDYRRWATLVGMGIFGSVAPFFLITTAQQTVDSSLAALYTSAAPIFVALGAHLVFSDERLTRGALAGVLLGFTGVAVLSGPEAIRGAGNSAALAQGMLVFATMNYAVSTLIARGAPRMDPIPFATGFLTVAAVVSFPLTLTVRPEAVTADWTHWAALAGLGIIPTALAQTLYMLLIARTSATFLSLTGYSIPVIGAGLGWIFFGETQTWQTVAAFLLILGGVWMARRGGGVR